MNAGKAWERRGDRRRDKRERREKGPRDEDTRREGKEGRERGKTNHYRPYQSWDSLPASFRVMLHQVADLRGLRDPPHDAMYVACPKIMRLNLRRLSILCLRSM